MSKRYYQNIALLGMATLSIFLPLHVFAKTDATALTTLAIVGKTTPVDQMQKQAEPEPLTDSDIQNIVKKELAARYKINTPMLTVGLIKSHAISNKSVSTPIVLVGCDGVSGRWLKHYDSKLLTMHPIGYVINCKGEVAYARLRTQSHIALVPTTGGVFAQRFHLSHYPVLITKSGVFQ